jgi:hypothetical protein
VSTTEELLERNISGFGLENQEYGLRYPSCLPRDTLSQQKLALTSPASGGHLVGIVRSRIKATEFISIISSDFAYNKIQSIILYNISPPS